MEFYSAMQSKLTGPFLLFALALLLWSGAAGLSSYLAQGEPAKESGHRAVTAKTEDSANVKQLRERASNDPKSVDAHLALASALHEEAFENRDNALLMDAVKAYQDVIALDAENGDALLGLATLCFEAGILDKSMLYYERYLKVRPDDLRAKTDFALAKIQANSLEEAEKILNEVIKAKPELYQAHLALALAWKLEGKKELAEKKANEAKKLAPTEDDRQRIDLFLKAMEERKAVPDESMAAEAKGEMSSEELSPAGQVSAYFQTHPIVGPKLKGISWPELKVAKIMLENFPVEQMPPFAKEKFIGGMKEKLKNLPERLNLSLCDAASGKELLRVEVGGGQ